MNIHLILITYSIDPMPLLQAADGEDITWHVFMHSQNKAVWDAIIDFKSKGKLEMYDYGVNRGLARSWNEGIIEAQKMGANAIIVINDDVMASREDILKLAQACVDHPECGIITAWGLNERMGQMQDNGYALFGINPIAIREIGYFDQNFTPIHFEDTDYSRRAALAGVKFINARDTNIVHKGSATVALVPELNRQNIATFQSNHDYYVRKWGGEPDNEEYNTPFDCAMYNLRISADERNDPYPGDGRTDLEIVKI